jgi:hypothetical protein
MRSATVSTVFINTTKLDGASYLIRMAVDLEQGNLQVTDLDVHIRIDLDNTSADELASGVSLVGNHDIRIDCYGHNHKTHLFQGIRSDGRVASRTPRTKYALLRFRYPAPKSAGDPPGWINLGPGAISPRRITTYYPAKHADDKLYPSVHLADHAAVHHIGLSGLDGESHPEPQELLNRIDARPLNAFTLADRADGSGAKLGLHSFRTNTCPWLDAILHQDAYWRVNPAGDAQPLTLKITSPGQIRGSVLTLRGMKPGRLFYTEAAGALARVVGVLPDQGRPAHDQWALGRPDAQRVLEPLCVGSLGGPPLSAWDIAGHGYERPSEASRAPVEMVVIEFDKPNVPVGEQFFENLRT